MLTQQQLAQLPLEEQRELLKLLKEKEAADLRQQARAGFTAYTKYIWPDFIEGKHHLVMDDAFDRILDGSLKRLIINMGPRHTKSEKASFLLPSKYLGHFPDRKVIQTSHTADLAKNFGRKVRNLVATRKYRDVFPGTELTPDAKAAGRWTTSKGGEYLAIGVGGKLAGYGADLLIIDDPHSEQDYISALGGNTDVFDNAFEWYQTGPRQRLQPGAAIVVVMCMTGDTPVLRPDGTETPLKDLRPSDRVATFEHGEVTTSVVNNHRSCGVDTVYAIQTQSGRMVRANERHPFLVERNGGQQWVRLKHLKVGDSLVSLRGVGERPEPKPDRASVPPARHGIITTGNIPASSPIQWAITASGRIVSVLAGHRSAQKGFAPSITSKNTRDPSQQLNRTGPDGSSIGTASRLSSMRRWWQNVTTAVMSVVNHPIPATPAPIGAASCASTMIMPPARSGACSATTATSRSGTERQQASCALPQTIYPDTILRIEPAGTAEVFDVEIDRTENFIANGLVSHNTRWHLRDMTGKLIKRMTSGSLDKWEIIELPAMLPNGKVLWPEFWSKEELEATKAELTPQQWNAQYLQNPTSEEGALVKREWWRTWEFDRPPQCEYIIQSWDTAYTKKDANDYCACTTWGVFYLPDEDNEVPRANIILLSAYRERMEFPELKKKALELYRKRQPDAFIVEAKASGLPLIQELRMQGIPVSEFTPTRGNDKIVRVNAVSDLFASGVVWAPDAPWAEEVIEEFAAFPSGENDDYVDSGTQALLRFRQGGFIPLDSDEEDEPMYSRKRAYY